MKCIIKVEGVDTPSKLHEQLLNFYSTEAQADRVYNTLQTPFFTDQFGDWKNNGNDPEFLNRVNEQGEPLLQLNNRGLPYFTAKNGKKIFLDNKMLDLPHEAREAIIQQALFQLFGNNVIADVELFDNVTLDQIETDTTRGSVASILQFNKKDLKDLKAMIKDRLQTMRINVKEKDDIADESGDFSDNMNSDALGIKQSFEKNDKDNASANMKFFLSFIPEMEFVNGKLQAKIKTIDIGNGVQLPFNSFVPFDQIWNKFQDTLADTVDFYQADGEVIPMFETMLQKLDEKFSNDGSVQYAIIKLLDMPDYKKNEFVQAFSTHKLKFYTSIINKEGTGIGFKFFRSDAAANPTKAIVNNWKENIKTSKFFSLVDGKYQLNKDKVKKFKDSYDTLFKKVKENVNKPFDEKYIKDLEMLLNYIGINASPETTSAYVYYYTQEGMSSMQGLLNTLDKFNFIVKDVSRLLADEYVAVKDNVIQEVYTGNGSKQLNVLAEIEKTFRKDLSENTIMGPEGKKYWIYSMPSYLSNKVKRLTKDVEGGVNNATLNGEIPPAEGFYENSVWLNILRDPVNNKEFFDNFDIITFNNLRLENVGDEGTDNKDIQEADQLADMLNKTLYSVKNDPAMKQSVYYTPTPADKGTSHHIIGAPFFKDLFQGYNPDGSIKISDTAIDIFAGYVIDEINRAAEELVKINNPEQYKKLYKDYHWVEEKGKIYYYGVPNKTKKSGYDFVTDRNIPGAVPVGNAFKSVLLPTLNFYDNTLFKGLFKDGKLTISNEQFKQLAPIRELISKTLNDDIQRNRQYFNEFKVIQNDELIIVDKEIQSKYSTRYSGEKATTTDAIMTDFVINQMISNIEFSKVFSGDYAYYKNMVDLSKRYPATYTNGIPLIQKEGDKQEYNLAVGPNIIMPSYTIEEMQAVSPNLARAYMNVNATDAQGYITLDRWYYLMQRSNHWSPKYEQAYQRFLNNTQTAEDYKLAAQPIKGVHFENTNGVPTYIKYSAAVLIPSVVDGTPLGRLKDAMLAQGIDEYVVVDGVKVGAITPSDVLDEAGKIKQEGISLNSITLRNNNYKIQQDLRPKGVKQTLIGSQIKKVVLTNLKDKALGQKLNDLLSAMSNKELAALEKSTGISTTGQILNKSLLWERLDQQLSSRGATENLRMALQKELDLDVVANYRQKIQNGIMSLINDTTVKIKSNGAAYIQMSSWGFDALEADNEGIKWIGEGAKENFSGLKAPRVVEGADGKKIVQPGQVFVSSNYIAKYIPNWKELSSEQLTKIIDARGLNMIGYRIPNQGKSSNDVLQIVGILPESYGDTIIPYVDITTKTGSDFDIDKMYVMIPNLKPKYTKGTYKQAREYLKNANISKQVILDTYAMLGAEGVISHDPEWLSSLKESALQEEFITDVVFNSDILNNPYYNEFKNKYGIGTLEKLEYITLKEGVGLKKQNKKALENAIMEAFAELILDPEMYDQYMMPLDQNPLGDDLDDLYGKEDPNVASYFFTPAYQLTKKFDNSGGKAGTGIVANQIVDHAFTQLKDVQFDGDIGIGNIDELAGTTSFAGEFDANGEHRITDVLSWFMTLYVDIAKDPKIAKGNHNTYTANTALMLVRAGVPYKIVNRIVGQEAVKEWVKISALRKSRVGIRDTRPLRQAVIEELGKKYNIPEHLIKKQVTDKPNKEDMQTLLASYRQSGLNKLQNGLESTIKNPSFQSQVKALDIFLHLHGIGESFAQTVIGSKQDVNGGGKDFISAFVDMNRKNYITDIGFINIDAKFDSTFLGAAYKNSTELSVAVMEKLFVTSNKAAQKIYNSIARMLDDTRPGLMDARFGNELEKGYFAHILGSKAFNLPKERLGKMFVGDDTTYDHVLKVRQMFPNNYFLNQLNLRLERNKKFIKMDSTRNNSPEALNEITRSWKELIDSDNIDAKKLGIELIYYSFYTSGFKSNISSFFEHIPHQKLADIVESTISEAKSHFINDGFSLPQFVDKFFRNNWQNDKVVPIVKGKLVKEGDLNGLFEVKEEAGTESKKTNRPYVRVEETIDTGAVSKRLYKQIGTIFNPETKQTLHYYKQVSKLGYSDNKGNNIVEYNDIKIDGSSLFSENNITSQAFLDKINLAEQKFYELVSINKNYKVYEVPKYTPPAKQIVDNNRDQDSDTKQGLDDGLITPICE